MFQIYVIGEDGILKELELAGFQYLGGPVCITSKCESKEREIEGEIMLKKLDMFWKILTMSL